MLDRLKRFFVGQQDSFSGYVKGTDASPLSFRERTAREGGFFWLPCSLCGEYMGGHEWLEVNGHLSSIPDDHHLSMGHGICVNCTASGFGCAAWTRKSGRIRHNCQASRDALV